MNTETFQQTRVVMHDAVFTINTVIMHQSFLELGCAGSE